MNKEAPKPWQDGHEDDPKQARMWTRLWQKQDKRRHDPCAICGRPVNTSIPRKFLHVVAGGLEFAAPGHEDETGGCMGWFPIGPTCAKKYDLTGLDVRKLDPIIFEPITPESIER